MTFSQYKFSGSETLVLDNNIEAVALVREEFCQ